ncbi:MAG TPA: FAD:protein FMN transferase [Anaerolineales bacterium]
MQYDEFRAMNSDILLAAEGAAERVAPVFAQVREFIAACEQRLTRFSDQSELSQLNRAAGHWFRVSPDLYDIVWQARQYLDQTDGLFDPSILGALRQAGYDRNMDEIRAAGGIAPAHELTVTQSPSFCQARFEPKTRSIWLPPGTQIDLGGIAKGWIAEQAAHRLAAHFTTCGVSAGGDMFLVGLPEGETSWPVALEDPRTPKNDLAVLRVRPGAVATSSVAKRRWVQGDRQQHHLIDPRRGEPAQTDWLSVTVVAPHAATAEVYAKALLIAGSRDADRVAAHHDDIAWIAVDSDCRLWGSGNSKELIDVER